MADYRRQTGPLCENCNIREQLRRSKLCSVCGSRRAKGREIRKALENHEDMTDVELGTIFDHYTG